MARRRRCPGPAGAHRYAGIVALPRKFLNDDEELLAELRPHWIFLFGPLFTSIGVWAALIVLVVLWRNAPSALNYPILIVAVIPGLWLLGRFVRWRSYVVALTSTRILVRQGILGRDTVQLRLQRITEVNIRQTLLERVLGTGSLLIDVQGEDDTLTLEYMRKPAVVQRVLNSQINEIVGGGRREAIPASMQPRDRHGAPYAHRDTDEHRGYDDGRYDDHDGDAHDTPPFGAGHRPLRDTGPAHRARRPAPARHPLRGGVRGQEERAPQPHLNAAPARPERPLQHADYRGTGERPSIQV
jgi:membrane protein YdbS with pleckstrin-like domain